MATIVVDLDISAQEYLKHYQISGAIVATRSRDGRSIRFPASLLQRFVTHSGVHGSFQIEYDQSGKFSAIRRLH